MASLGLFPSLPPSAWARAPFEQLPFPLEEDVSFYAWGRHALWHGLGVLDLQPGDEVLCPTYHHGSEIEALGQRGLLPRWYEPDDRLEPREEELERLLGERTRALYLIHYLGFPRQAARWRAWCDSHGLLLLEDVGQAMFATVDGRPAGSFGHAAIFCAYKSLPVPDGGLLVSQTPAQAPPVSGRAGLGRLARGHGAWVAQRWAPVGALRPQRAEGPYDPDADFALGDPESAPAAATRFLLPRLAAPDVADRRRANYRVLLEALADQVPEPFAEITDGAAPLALPLRTDDVPRLMAHLRRAGVEPSHLWAEPHRTLPHAEFPASAQRRATTVLVPVHQELRPQDVERVAAAAGPSARSLPPALELAEVERLEDLAEEWPPLAEQTGNVFSTYEWAAAWWRHLGAGRRKRLATCRTPQGELVAVLPLYEWSRPPATVLRFIGHGAGDELGPVCHPRDAPRVARALRRALRSGALPCDALLAETMRGERGWGALLGARLLTREQMPTRYVRGEGWEELLSSFSSSTRREIRKDERNLARDHDLRFRLVGPEDRLAKEMQTLFSLHEARWGEASSAFSGPTRDLHLDFAADALARGWLRLWFLELDGRAVAAQYGFRFGNVEFLYQTGRDPAFERAGVGGALTAAVVRAAMEDGVDEVCFGRGDEKYKWRYANRDPGLDTLALACSHLGTAALAAVSGANHSPRLRQVLAQRAAG